MIENVALIKSADPFYFSEDKIYGYHVPPQENGLIVKFLYTTKFGFTNKHHLRFTIEKKFKGDLLCLNGKVKEHILGQRDILNLETAELEIDGREQRSNSFKIQKKFLRGYELNIVNDRIGLILIGASKIKADSINQIGKEQFDRDVKELMETKTL